MMVYEVDVIIRHGNSSEITEDDLNKPRVLFFDDTKEFVVSNGDGTFQNVTRMIKDLYKEIESLRQELGVLKGEEDEDNEEIPQLV